MRMPLFGCIAVLAFAIGLVFLALLYGYVKARSVLSNRDTAVARAQKRAKELGLSVSHHPSSPPFAVPEGYVVRTVVRQHPCGKASYYFVVLPAYDEPCGDGQPVGAGTGR